VEEWISSGSPNYGMMLKMDGETLDKHRFYASQHETVATRPYLLLDYDYNGDNYVVTIKNTTYTETEEDPEETPGTPEPIPSGDTILTAQPSIRATTLSSYNFTSTSTNRYMMIMFWTGNWSNASILSALSLGGSSFTKITQGNTPAGYTVTQIWGLPIPDSWTGAKTFVATGPYPPAYIFLFANVDPTNPVLESKSTYSNTGQIYAASAINCYKKGVLYSVLSLRTNSLVPIAQSGNTRLYYSSSSTHSGGISRKTYPELAVWEDYNTTRMYWKWGDTVSRFAHSIVSLRPS
jgi:hypothetical protein